MTIADTTTRKPYSISTLPEESLDIEIICDEDYRRNKIYCSWQEIIAGGSVASPDSPESAPSLVVVAR